jgi:hypothetical protein
MAVLATTHPTLLDFANREGVDGKVQKVAEVLNLTNEILEDAVWVEGNLPTGHKTTVRTGIPAPTWRKLNYGVVPGKSTTAQVTDTAGNMEAYAEVDKMLADLNGNEDAWRLSEDMAYVEGMNQEFASTLFYGNDLIDEAKFTGLAARFNSLSAQSADNIVLQPGTDASDNASIWLVGWGPNTVHMFFPKGIPTGIQVEDLGRVTVENAPGGPTGGRMEAYRTHYQWTGGLSVRDWRYVVRIQFNQEDLVKDATSGPDLIDLMTDAVERLPQGAAGSTRLAWYMNRRTRTFLRKQITNAVKNASLTMDTVAGKRVLAFDDIPVRRCDALLATETVIS